MNKFVGLLDKRDGSHKNVSLQIKPSKVAKPKRGESGATFQYFRTLDISAGPSKRLQMPTVNFLCVVFVLKLNFCRLASSQRDKPKIFAIKPDRIHPFRPIQLVATLIRL